MGSPIVGSCDGDHHFDKKQLQWSLPFIDSSNKSGSMEFSMNGAHPDNFFPVNVSFTSKKPYCDIQVRWHFLSFSHYSVLLWKDVEGGSLVQSIEHRTLDLLVQETLL